jgi:antitoxin MazE
VRRFFAFTVVEQRRCRNYNVIMKARIIRIGNSRGIRLPKAVLEHAHLTGEVRIDAEPNQIIIRAAHIPREGWEEAFRLMADRGDDTFTDEPVSLTAFDEVQWKW